MSRSLVFPPPDPLFPYLFLTRCFCLPAPTIRAPLRLPIDGCPRHRFFRPVLPFCMFVVAVGSVCASFPVHPHPFTRSHCDLIVFRFCVSIQFGFSLASLSQIDRSLLNCFVTFHYPALVFSFFPVSNLSCEKPYPLCCLRAPRILGPFPLIAFPSPALCCVALCNFAINTRHFHSEPAPVFALKLAFVRTESFTATVASVLMLCLPRPCYR